MVPVSNEEQYLKKYIYILSLFIYFERETALMQVGEEQRERERESQAGSALSAQTPK